MGSLGRGRGTEIDGPSDAPASGELAEVRNVSVDPQRQRTGSVHVLLEHRHPVVRQVSGQLELHARIVDRDVRGQNQGIPVALLPQAVNHGRHQPQHAPSALELHQRRPIRVQAVEDLRMYRIGRLDPLLVVRVTARGRELLALGPIEVRERPGDHVPVRELRGVRERLEQPSPHDLEAFLGARRPPGRLDSPDHVSQPIERLASALSADLDVIGLGVGRAGRIRGGQADHEQAVIGELGGFGQHLRKAELGLEAAGRKVALVVQLAGVGDPLVDEDQAGTEFLEELAQHITGGWSHSRHRRQRARTLPCRPVATPARPTAFARPCRRAWSRFPGEILLPTSTTRRAPARWSACASCSTGSTPASSLGAVPENRW